mmetsp:Transcript_17511/g.31679  ORF Transcript_17511/g.31679 Transcript_17511/m.31679 type:complete len:116 (-) Transcript_17511:890-1237(-)
MKIKTSNNVTNPNDATPPRTVTDNPTNFYIVLYWCWWRRRWWMLFEGIHHHHHIAQFIIILGVASVIQHLSLYFVTEDDILSSGPPIYYHPLFSAPPVPTSNFKLQAQPSASFIH